MATSKSTPNIPTLRLGGETHFGAIPGVGAPPLTTPQLKNLYPNKDVCYVPEMGRMSLNNLPGYGGFIPGKGSENVLGATFNRANELAQIACERREIPFAEEDLHKRKVNPYGLGRREGSDIPGYCGFIPGKYADGVFGRTFAKSNEVSTEVRRSQAKSSTHVPPDVPTTGALGFTGFHPAYMAKEKAPAYQPPTDRGF